MMNLIKKIMGWFGKKEEAPAKEDGRRNDFSAYPRDPMTGLRKIPPHVMMQDKGFREFYKMVSGVDLEDAIRRNNIKRVK